MGVRRVLLRLQRSCQGRILLHLRSREHLRLVYAWVSIVEAVHLDYVVRFCVCGRGGGSRVVLEADAERWVWVARLLVGHRLRI